MVWTVVCLSVAMLRAENAALRRGEGQPAADAVVQGLRAEVHGNKMGAPRTSDTSRVA